MATNAKKSNETSARQTPIAPPRQARVSTVPPDETKEQKFRRLATKRVNKALKAVDAIGQLSSASYQSTPEQRAAVIKTIQDAVNFMVGRLNKEDQKKVTFSL